MLGVIKCAWCGKKIKPKEALFELFCSTYCFFRKLDEFEKQKGVLA